jgi:hypothetical protein
MNRTISTSCALSVIAFFSLAVVCPPSCGDAKGEVEFQILTDKAVYSPGSTMQVKFIVTNLAEEPLYIYRDLYVCSGQLGFVFFQILDQGNKDVRGSGCSGDIWPPGEEVEHLTNPKTWILLKQGDVYGGATDFKLPAKKGVYRLKAELIPTGFTDKQKETLSQRHMRVLRSPFPAPIVSITVK